MANTNEVKELEISDPVVKELDFTKAAYEKLVVDIKEELDNTKKKSGTAYQELNGMYYCAIIGLIRAGALCSRTSGKDGFPEIRVFIGSKYYKCREDVIYSIIGAEEADELITPFEDDTDNYTKSLSHISSAKTVAPAAANVTVYTETTPLSKKESKSQETALRKELENLKKEKKEAEEKAASKYNELNSRYQKAVEASKNLPVVSSAEDAEIINEFKEKLAKSDNVVESLKAELIEWKSKYDEVNRECRKANESAEDAEKRAGRLQRKLDEKEEEAKKYVYDPNYDHYYSDELPVIIESLEFNHTGSMVRIGAVVACFVGIAACLLMFI